MAQLKQVASLQVALTFQLKSPDNSQITSDYSTTQHFPPPIDNKSFLSHEMSTQPNSPIHTISTIYLYFLRISSEL
jgi:hypothetical protein